MGYWEPISALYGSQERVKEKENQNYYTHSCLGNRLIE